MTTPDPNATLVATPSKYVRNKNLLLLALVGGFFFMFVKDGLFGYPASNDAQIALFKEKYKDKLQLSDNARFADLFNNWPGWKNATLDQKNLATKFVQDNRLPESWHNALDIETQVYIAMALGGLTVVAIWWFFHCQRRRATGNATMLSPSRGVEIPWSAITKIDNTKWKKSGIVWVTYNDQGESSEAKLDEYHLDNLRPILQLMDERAPQAEVISPDSPAESTDKTSDASDHHEAK